MRKFIIMLMLMMFTTTTAFAAADNKNDIITATGYATGINSGSLNRTLAITQARQVAILDALRCLSEMIYGSLSLDSYEDVDGHDVVTTQTSHEANVIVAKCAKLVGDITFYKSIAEDGTIDCKVTMVISVAEFNKYKNKISSKK